MPKPLAVLCCVAFAACSVLPSSGPTEHDVYAAEKQANSIGFKIVDVTPQVVAVLDSAQPPGIHPMDLGGRPPRLDIIGPGDTLGISIYEVGNAIFSGGGGGGVSGEAPAGSTNANGVRLPPMQVDASGSITVPFVGRVTAAGHTPVQLAEIIRNGLLNVSQDPQVLVNVTESLSNAVFVEGDVKNPGRRQLTLNHEHLLDIVALSGGSSFPPQETMIELTRNGHASSDYLRHVEDTPEENVALQPGDRVRLFRLVRSYTVFGASGKVSEVPFETPTVNLAEGVARAGGPTDDRADPNAVFLFRFEPPDLAAQLGATPPEGTPPAAPRPVIYRLDMMNPSSYFLAQQFPMRNQDLIYVANARSDLFSKFVNIVYSLAIPGLTAVQATK